MRVLLNRCCQAGIPETLWNCPRPAHVIIYWTNPTVLAPADSGSLSNVATVRRLL